MTSGLRRNRFNCSAATRDEKAEDARLITPRRVALYVQRARRSGNRNSAVTICERDGALLSWTVQSLTTRAAHVSITQGGDHCANEERF
jgi:hypothetical protein